MRGNLKILALIVLAGLLVAQVFFTPTIAWPEAPKQPLQGPITTPIRPPPLTTPKVSYRIEFHLYLDMDQKSDTGCNMAEKYSGWRDLGADVKLTITLRKGETPTAKAYYWNGENWKDLEDGEYVGGGVGEDYVEVRFPYTPSPDYQPPWNVVCKSAWAEEFYLMTVIPILYIPPDYAPNSGYGTFNESNEYVTVINDPGGETAKAVDIVEVEMKIASGSGEYLYVKIIDAGPIDPSNPPSPPVGGIVCPPSTIAILKEKCSQNVFPFPRVGGPSGI